MSRPRRRVKVVPSDELPENKDSGYRSAPTNSAISTQLHLLMSEKATERMNGLRELSDILRDDQSNGNTLAASIPPDAWKEVVSWTIGILKRETTAFVNKFGQEWPQVPVAAEQMGKRIRDKYSTPMRHIWSIGMPYFSGAMARTVVAHIMESLAEDECLEYVLGLDFAKTLHAWASHLPHVYNCKDEIARAIVEWCICSLTRYNAGVESQQSEASSSVMGPVVKLVESDLAATLLAIVKTSTPKRLLGRSKMLIDFCAEYCSSHAHENAQTAIVLEIANIVLLASPDTHLVLHQAQLKPILEACLRLWSTRKPNLATAVLYGVRILTRLFAQIYEETPNVELLALLELSLKTMTAGSWERHGFTNLPRGLSSIWQLVYPQPPQQTLVPIELFAPLSTIVRPNQLAFFDTVAYLAAFLTQKQTESSMQSTGHRKKRQRKAPTSLERLIAAIVSSNSNSESRGAAQAVWYMVCIYPHMLGTRLCGQLLDEFQALLQDNDTSKLFVLEEWILATIQALAHTADRVSLLNDSVWQRAVDGVRSGVSGAAALVYDMLHSPGSKDAHLLFQQAADALDAHTKRQSTELLFQTDSPRANGSGSRQYDPGTTRLLLYLASYIRPGDDGTLFVKACFQSILQVCERASKECWPKGLFAAVIEHHISVQPQINSNSLVLASEWNMEVRFVHVLNALALQSSNMDTCTLLVRNHVPRQQRSSAAKKLSSLSPTQWRLVGIQLLTVIEQCTQFEVSRFIEPLVPYVSLAICQISKHLQKEAQDSSSSGIAKSAEQLTHMFRARFVSFVAETKSIERVWQTIMFISEWTDGYSCIASLDEAVDRLLRAVFNSNNSHLLRALVEGDPVSLLSSMQGPKQGVWEAHVPEGTMLTETQLGESVEGELSLQQRDSLEARMLCVAFRITRLFGDGLARVLAALAEKQSHLKAKFLSSLLDMITNIDVTQILMSLDSLVHCCIMDGSAELLGALMDRILPLMKSYGYKGHMPTIFSILRAMSALLQASSQNAALASDQDLPRFIGWLDTEIQKSRMDPLIETVFMREVVGPWSRDSNGVFDVLSVLGITAIDVLQRQAQTACSTLARLVAEEQLAALGLQLPFIDSSGAIDYPDIDYSGIDNLNEALVVMTRNFGLAMLVSSSKSVPPGILVILLEQIQRSETLPCRVVALCHRLLQLVSAEFGIASVDQLLVECASDVFSVDVSLYSAVTGLLRSDDTKQKCQVNVSAALEWILQEGFEQARSVLLSVDATTYDTEHIAWLLAHSVALTMGNSAKYDRLKAVVLDAAFTHERVQSLLTESLNQVMLSLVTLYQPQPTVKEEVQNFVSQLRGTLPAANVFANACSDSQLLLPQWGRRYKQETIVEAAEKVVGGVKMSDWMQDARLSWLVLEIEARMHKTQVSDNCQRLAISLYVLLGMSLHVLDSALTEAVLPRIVADNWLAASGCNVQLGLLPSALMADHVDAKCMERLFAGLSNRLAKQLPQLDTHQACLAARMLAQLQQTRSDVRMHISQSLEPLCDWSVAKFAVTSKAVWRMEDRLELVRLAERAAYQLGVSTDACTDIIASASERILQLALCKAPNPEQPMYVDLSTQAVLILSNVRLLVVRYMREHSSGLLLRAKAQLLRAMSVLAVLAPMAAEEDEALQIKCEGDVRWLVSNTLMQSKSARAALAAIQAAAQLDKDTIEKEAIWLDLRHRQLLRAATSMPVQPGAGFEPRSLDAVFLHELCMDRDPEDALAELVTSVAARKECSRFHTVLPLVRADPDTAQNVFPHIIARILRRCDMDMRTSLAAMLLDFAHNWAERAPSVARTVISRTLDTRRIDMLGAESRWADVRTFAKDLPLALFEIADVAARLGMLETAVFMIEIDIDCQDGAGSMARMDCLSDEARELLRNVYMRLGNHAAAAKLGSVDTYDAVERRCRDAGDWRTLLLLQEANAARDEVGDTLVQLGMLNAVRPGNVHINRDAAAAAAWRLGRWDEPTLPLDHLKVSPEQALYRILRLRASGHVLGATHAAQEFIALPEAITALTAPCGWRQDWPYHAVSALLPLIGSDGAFARASAASSLALEQMAPLGRSALESAHLVRTALYSIAAQENSGLFDLYYGAVQDASEAARRAGGWQTAMNLTFRLRGNSHAKQALQKELRLWEAETLWEAGSRRLALEMLCEHKHVLELQKKQQQPMDDAATILLSRVVLMVGEWSDELCTERPDVLWKEYFESAADLLANVVSPTAWAGRAMHALASFAERQCAKLTAECNDEAAAAMREQKKREKDACERAYRNAANVTEKRDYNEARMNINNQIKNDERELKELQKKSAEYLSVALWGYLMCLKHCNSFDSSIYPLVSLIVTHAHSPALHEKLGLLDDVPSRKLLPLVHQLCAHLGSEATKLSRAIEKNVTRMAADFPYHVLYHLFALRNANRNSEHSSRPSPKSPDPRQQLEIRRTSMATSILHSLAAQSKGLEDIVGAIDSLCTALIELAYVQLPQEYSRRSIRDPPIRFDARLRIEKLRKSLPANVPVITADAPAEVPRDYAAVPVITSICDGFLLVGGINMPKIVRVRGSDGHCYKQLVKGRDDLRQDAVIQQLFAVINRFLESSSRSDVRDAAGMRIRTFQVVPLTKRSGVIQWAENTVPLGNWLANSGKKYRPGAPSMKQQREAVQRVHSKGGVTAEEKQQVYERVCGKLPPVFRFFFYENFYDPRSWFRHREAYIRSAAVSSMAGWLLGIGDRHLQNILLDVLTAELVHIDLGIAFDFGKLLTVPEQVPFRLTREMVDGMGLLGLEALFHHACQVALSAMRKNSHIVMTILNVLKVDPLYKWTLIPLYNVKVRRNTSMMASDFGSISQGNAAGDASAEVENKEALRSIMQVGQRLNASISVEGQVSDLVQQATDPSRLSRMYFGWSAWC
ncbi:Serine/threonine-protein kinase tel1 [Coemansia sp. RSA 1085]|nr:Serine/threonine-protein kinase tel1 [Coemansia sp. RSA 1085]